jgi:hypothetical protein
VVAEAAVHVKQEAEALQDQEAEAPEEKLHLEEMEQLTLAAVEAEAVLISLLDIMVEMVEVE